MKTPLSIHGVQYLQAGSSKYFDDVARPYQSGGDSRNRNHQSALRVYHGRAAAYLRRSSWCLGLCPFTQGSCKHLFQTETAGPKTDAGDEVFLPAFLYQHHPWFDIRLLVLPFWWLVAAPLSFRCFGLCCSFAVCGESSNTSAQIVAMISAPLQRDVLSAVICLNTCNPPLMSGLPHHPPPTFPCLAPLPWLPCTLYAPAPIYLPLPLPLCCGRVAGGEVDCDAGALRFAPYPAGGVGAESPGPIAGGGGLLLMPAQVIGQYLGGLSGWMWIRGRCALSVFPGTRQAAAGASRKVYERYQAGEFPYFAVAGRRWRRPRGEAGEGHSGESAAPPDE